MSLPFTPAIPQMAAHMDEPTGVSTNRGRSPRLWQAMDKNGASIDGIDTSTRLGDDFTHFGGVVATTEIHQGYKGFLETANTINPVADVSGGICRLYCDGTGADDDPVIASNGDIGAAILMDVDKLTIFETRVRVTSVTDAKAAWFIGLMEPGVAAAAGVMANTTGNITGGKGCLGFHIDHTDADSLTLAYQETTESAAVAGITYSEAFAITDWYKLGFILDPSAPDAKRIAMWINGEEYTTSYITSTVTADETVFPDDEGLNFVAAIKALAAETNQLDVDWWALYQEG